MSSQHWIVSFLCAGNSARGILAESTRIKLFQSLPLQSIDRMRLQESLDEIGKTPPEPQS